MEFQDHQAAPAELSRMESTRHNAQNPLIPPQALQTSQLVYSSFPWQNDTLSLRSASEEQFGSPGLVMWVITVEGSTDLVQGGTVDVNSDVFLAC